MNRFYSKTFSLAVVITIAAYGCQSDKTATDKSQPKAVATKAPERKPDSVMKYAKGPSIPAAKCCRGFPSRGKALAAKK